MLGFLQDSHASKSVWEKTLTFSLLGSLLFGQISISAVQSFLAIALIAWILLVVKKRIAVAFPSFFWPLAGYAALSLISSAASVDPALSLRASRKLLLYALVPIVYTAFRKTKEITLAYTALLASSLVNGLYSTIYFIFRAYPGQRVKGFMGHYMTQAGILALFGSLALGMILLGRGKDKPAWAAGLGLSSAALAFTLTRSAWVGLAVALCVIILLWKPKAFVLVPVVAGLIFFAAPPAIKGRIRSIFSLRDSSNIARVEYLGAGLKIIRDFPLLGTGPDTVDIVFQNPKYGLSEISRKNVHLHNNVIQIAAERGLAALAAWLAFIIMAFLALIRLLGEKNSEVRAPAAGAIAALAALCAAGFFEYNFGDSEVTTLLLFIITLPFALERVRGPKPETGSFSARDRQKT